MALRPGRTTRKIERPYTRVSRSKPRKSYVVGVPFPKIHQFEMGDRKGNYNLTVYGIAKYPVQIRHNALEAARIVTTKFLEKSLGTSFFFKILKFPHHVIREKPIAQGAGADRYSQGMAHAFGKPYGTGVQIHPGEKLMMIKVSKESLETAKQAMKKASLKLSTPLRIETEQ
jgi:large subunit ribosomal protein L10e